MTDQPNENQPNEERLVSIVVPGLNEGPSLAELSRRVNKALAGVRDYELIFVDDGSSDDSWQVISDLAKEDSRIKGISLRANFGKAKALSAGFGQVRGDVVIMMDADLQDDPADLPRFLAKLDDGNDVVVGWKKNPQGPF